MLLSQTLRKTLCPTPSSDLKNRILDVDEDHPGFVLHNLVY